MSTIKLLQQVHDGNTNEVIEKDSIVNLGCSRNARAVRMGLARFVDEAGNLLSDSISEKIIEEQTKLDLENAKTGTVKHYTDTEEYKKAIENMIDHDKDPELFSMFNDLKLDNTEDINVQLDAYIQSYKNGRVGREDFVKTIEGLTNNKIPFYESKKVDNFSITTYFNGHVDKQELSSDDGKEFEQAFEEYQKEKEVKPEPKKRGRKPKQK